MTPVQASDGAALLVAGRFEVTAWITGSVAAGVARGRDRETGAPILVTLVGAGADAVSWGPFDGAGVTACLLAGPAQAASPAKDGAVGPFDALIEGAPRGTPLSDVLGSRPGRATVARWVAALALVVRGLLRRGATVEIHPECVGIVDAGEGSRPATVEVAPRGAVLLRARRSEQRELRTWNPGLPAPEVLLARAGAGGEASLVFSLCALGYWLLTGTPPHGTTLESATRAAATGASPPAGSDDLPILARGLDPQPRARPSLDLLISTLDAAAGTLRPPSDDRSVPLDPAAGRVSVRLAAIAPPRALAGLEFVVAGIAQPTAAEPTLWRVTLSDPARWRKWLRRPWTLPLVVELPSGYAPPLSVGARVFVRVLQTVSGIHPRTGAEVRVDGRTVLCEGDDDFLAGLQQVAVARGPCTVGGQSDSGRAAAQRGLVRVEVDGLAGYADDAPRLHRLDTPGGPCLFSGVWTDFGPGLPPPDASPRTLLHFARVNCPPDRTNPRDAC